MVELVWNNMLYTFVWDTVEGNGSIVVRLIAGIYFVRRLIYACCHAAGSMELDNSLYYIVILYVCLW